MLKPMKKHALTLVAALALTAAALPAHAACYADYKAKKDNPLQLHYGVIALPDNACSSARAAAGVVAPRLANAGWTLLNIVSVFGDEGLNRRKANAGQHFLRY